MDIVTLGAAKSQTESYVKSHFVAGSNIIIESNLDGTQTISASGEVSSEDTVARAAINAIKDGTTIDSFGDVESALATKVDKVSGKGLSTNDFTNTLKTKLDGIASGAEVNVQSDWNQTDNTTDDYIKNKPTLGTAAAAATTDFATATQGTKADSAIQSAGSGLSKSGTTLNHSNSVTAKTTQALRKTSFDAQGHITGSSELSTAESNALSSGIDSTKVAQIATNTSAITGKQDTIDSSHKLDADLVDDSTSTNKFATAAELSQIETNKNNISSLDTEIDTVANLGAKNLLDLSNVVPTVPSGLICTNNGDGTYTVSGTLSSANSIKFAISVIEGNLILSGCPSGGGDSSYMQRITKDGTAVVNTNDTGSGSNSFTMSGTGYELNFRFAAGTYTNVTFKPMLRPASISDSTYQPYTKSNSDLTALSAEDRAALVELVDNGAKNILDLTKATEVVKADELSYTLAADGTLTVTWTADLSSSGKTLNFKGFPYKAGTYILSGAQLDGSSSAVRADVREGSTAIVSDYGQPPTPFELPSNGYNYVIRVQAPAGSATFKPMICTKVDWDISQAYVPYRPSEDEQNAQIASNGLRVVLSQQSNSSSTYTYQMKSSDFPVPYSCGCYMISIITWGTTPTYSLYSIAYSGNHTDYTVITKIAGSDANVSVSSDTISVTSSGKVTIMAMR